MEDDVFLSDKPREELHSHHESTEIGETLVTNVKEDCLISFQAPKNRSLGIQPLNLTWARCGRQRKKTPTCDDVINI